MEREWWEAYVAIPPLQRRLAVLYVSSETIGAYCVELNRRREAARLEQVRALGPACTSMPSELIQPVAKIVPLEPMSLFGRPLRIDDDVPFGELRISAPPPGRTLSWN